ncbi:hypothetical protein [Rhodococcus sp. 11-3]|uniref:hypothetical protein n=1 Tax=Rhodococcus sp. 11-3 TaxID=2854796 RepID=UPI00203CE50F|nr:hypothetical protein [Rhodococcus sp. 11-3]USC18462.1 hypothetical protein KZJ41_28205 [Rhodococcus sp. 11-3]
MTTPPDPLDALDFTPEPDSTTRGAHLCKVLLDAAESSIDLAGSIRRRYDALDPGTVQLVDDDEHPVGADATRAALLRIMSGLDDALTAFTIATEHMRAVEAGARRVWPAPGDAS